MCKKLAAKEEAIRKRELAEYMYGIVRQMVRNNQSVTAIAVALLEVWAVEYGYDPDGIAPRIRRALEQAQPTPQHQQGPTVAKVRLLDRFGNKGYITFDPTIDPIEGGEGAVYFTQDKQHVLKIYNDRVLQRKDPNIIAKIMNAGPAPHDPEYRLFGWPGALIFLDANYSHFVGIAMRNVMTDGWLEEMIWWSNIKTLVDYSQRRPDRVGDFRGRIKAGIDIANAIRFLNFQGFAQADISGRNFLINPVEGRAVLIDLDGLAVPGHMDSAVLGTPGYMAPEIVIGLHEGRPASPSILSDRHALAVLLYQLLLINHPLLGGVMPDISNDQTEDMLLRMGKVAVYVEHPTDHRNRVSSGMLTTAILSSRLQKLFKRAFVDGLYNPSARPQHYEFKEALEAYLHDLVDCDNRDCIFGQFATHGGRVWTCPVCGTKKRHRHR